MGLDTPPNLTTETLKSDEGLLAEVLKKGGIKKVVVVGLATDYVSVEMNELQDKA